MRIEGYEENPVIQEKYRGIVVSDVSEINLDYINGIFSRFRGLRFCILRLLRGDAIFENVGGKAEEVSDIPDCSDIVGNGVSVAEISDKMISAMLNSVGTSDVSDVIRRMNATFAIIDWILDAGADTSSAKTVEYSIDPALEAKKSIIGKKGLQTVDRRYIRDMVCAAFGIEGSCDIDMAGLYRYALTNKVSMDRFVSAPDTDLYEGMAEGLNVLLAGCICAVSVFGMEDILLKGNADIMLDRDIDPDGPFAGSLRLYCDLLGAKMDVFCPNDFCEKTYDVVLVSRDTAEWDLRKTDICIRDAYSHLSDDGFLTAVISTNFGFSPRGYVLRRDLARDCGLIALATSQYYVATNYGRDREQIAAVFSKKVMFDGDVVINEPGRGCFSSIRAGELGYSYMVVDKMHAAISWTSLEIGYCQCFGPSELNGMGGITLASLGSLEISDIGDVKHFSKKSCFGVTLVTKSKTGCRFEESRIGLTGISQKQISESGPIIAITVSNGLCRCKAFCDSVVDNGMMYVHMRLDNPIYKYIRSKSSDISYNICMLDENELIFNWTSLFADCILNPYCNYLLAEYGKINPVMIERFPIVCNLFHFFVDESFNWPNDLDEFGCDTDSLKKRCEDNRVYQTKAANYGKFDYSMFQSSLGAYVGFWNSRPMYELEGSSFKEISSRDKCDIKVRINCISEELYELNTRAMDLERKKIMAHHVLDLSHKISMVGRKSLENPTKCDELLLEEQKTLEISLKSSLRELGIESEDNLKSYVDCIETERFNVKKKCNLLETELFNLNNSLDWICSESKRGGFFA